MRILFPKSFTDQNRCYCYENSISKINYGSEQTFFSVSHWKSSAFNQHRRDKSEGDDMCYVIVMCHYVQDMLHDIFLINITSDRYSYFERIIFSN